MYFKDFSITFLMTYQLFSQVFQEQCSRGSQTEHIQANRQDIKNKVFILAILLKKT